MKVDIAKRKCNLCHLLKEGFLFKHWFWKFFICETCISKWFSRLSKHR